MTKIYTLCLVCFTLSGYLLASPSPYQMAETESVLPIKVIDKLVVVEAVVDGRRGYFLFDTGIGSLALNDRYFGDEENLRKFRKMTDINGNRAKLEGCLVNSFKWGGVERDSFNAPLMDLRQLEEIMECELLGLLGWEVYQDLEVIFDYDAEQLTLRKLDSDGDALSGHPVRSPRHVIPFEMEQHIPVLKARVGDLTLRLGWDTGASINVFNKKLRRNLPENARKLMRIPYGGVLSDRRAPFIAVDAIHVDDQFTVIGWRMAATKMRHFKKREINIDGLIGADLFRLGKVAINYRRQEISLWINDNLFSQRYQATKGAGLARKPASVSSEK